MTFLRCLALSVIPFLLPAAVAAQTIPPTRHQQPSESVEPDRERQTAILESVLRFYRPGGAQSRWIDTQTLPAAPGALPGALAPGLVETLVVRLGRGRFCASDARSDCQWRQGGRIRVSPVYVTDTNHARVVVEFESVWPYGPSIVSAQVMWLIHGRDGWRIERRAGVE